MNEVKGKAQKDRELQWWEKPLSAPIAVPKPEKKKKGREAPKEIE